MHKAGAAIALLVATPALADSSAPGVTEDEIERPSEIEPSVAAGALLPWTVGARHDRPGILVGSYGGYDRSKRAPIMQGVLEGTFVDRVTLRAVATNTGMSDQLRPAVGVLVDITREAHQGVDVAVGGEYEVEGWNTVPALVTRAALGRTVGLTRLQANAAFGLGVEAGERYGDLRLSGLRPVAQSLFAGVDTRARIDLERDDDEPSGELEWDVQAGPMLSLAAGRFALSATGGVSAWKTRAGDVARVGAIGALGLGAAF